MEFENINQENNQEIQENTLNNNNDNRRPQGKFFQKKILYLIFSVLVIFIMIILFRNELFSTNTEIKKDIKKKEEQNNAPPPLEANYEKPTDLDVTYEKERILEEDNPDYHIPAQEEISQEEQDRLNRLKELEQEALNAFRSPTSITIAARPQGQNNNGIINSSQSTKPVQDYDGNRQESKKNFLMNEAAQKFYQTNFLVEALSEFELKAGDFIPAIMITGINSDLPSKIITAVVSENVKDTVSGRHILIPQGTKVIGTYDSSITFGQERLLVIWQRLILPNGKSLALDNMQGVDLTGQAGITGEINNHFATLLKGVILSSFLGSVATITSADSFGNDNWRTAASQGAGEQIISIGDRFAEKALSRQPTITVRPGERFNIMIHSDLILEPYGE